MQFNQSDDELVENHDINVTPFIDVMLVLLIIFMVVAPLATVSVPIELPASNVENDSAVSEAVIVTIDSQGDYFIDQEPVALTKLPSVITTLVAKQEQPLVYIQADKHIDYQQLMQLMNVIRSQGISNIGLVAVPETE
ncbi:biopolymer transporter ExbD [Thalassotalea sp. 1_MG-2023]|uniref:ExbD/TolR family protein n=1 Tax=Thalassotalea sp. 1_MG-2023 TaxID=3062680 RepID=UPI0026E2494A|nr:biopolymer transporter ExbD [Thalassotalea sp. 1_MG-2023]MDO6428608.1 biopolymer transporter ExbD [Thalassotalea sp. 1_MG-2023]